jgi:hypothetical protein
VIDFDLIAWDDADDPDGNVQHIADHGLTVDDVEAALDDPDNRPIVSRSSGFPAIFGRTPDGRESFVVYEVLGDDPRTVIRPKTADEPTPESRSQRCTPGPARPWIACPRRRGPPQRR